MLQIQPDGIWVVHRSWSNQESANKVKNKSKLTTEVKPTILVVDDEQIVADTTAQVLNLSGFEAIRAYDGQEALKIAVKLQPDYLLTDVLMPDMNGVELAIAVAKICPSTKTLLFSGQAGIADILEQGEEQGYEFDLVAKPIHPQKLIERIKNM